MGGMSLWTCINNQKKYHFLFLFFFFLRLTQHDSPAFHFLTHTHIPRYAHRVGQLAGQGQIPEGIPRQRDGTGTILFYDPPGAGYADLQGMHCSLA